MQKEEISHSQADQDRPGTPPENARFQKNTEPAAGKQTENNEEDLARISQKGKKEDGDPSLESDKPVKE